MKLLACRTTALTLGVAMLIPGPLTAYEVAKEHPRIWLRKADLPDLARRCGPGGPMAEEYQAMKTAVNEVIVTSSPAVLGHWLPEIPLVYLVEKSLGRDASKYSDFVRKEMWGTDGREAGASDEQEPDSGKPLAAGTDKGPSSGAKHVARGGSWTSTASWCTAVARTGLRPPPPRSDHYGFRVACEQKDFDADVPGSLQCRSSAIASQKSNAVRPTNGRPANKGFRFAPPDITFVNTNKGPVEMQSKEH